MAFAFRGLELHGRRMWERRRIEEALAFITSHELTALVLHETDLLPQVTFPRAYFDPYALWTGAPTRRGENALQNNRVYLDHVLHLAARAGVPVWIEIKELTFPDELLERHPHLLKNGRVCPSEPVWFEFLEAQFRELVQEFPGLAGVILSAGSPEGRAARSQGKCTCALCRATDLEAWYSRIIASAHGPLARAGLRLAVRDFAYTPAAHEPLIRAVDRAPAAVIFCMKVTPHDFYPTFPDNPAIGRLAREQWVEYDVYGQFYGWGVFPVFVRDDLARRLGHAEARGVTGALFRTEWERVNDWWCLETPNRANLIAAARLAAGRDAPSAVVCRAWLAEAGWPSDGDTAAFVGDLWDRTWPLVRGGIYLRDFVFHDSSMFPRSLWRAWWTVETKHSLADWDPARAGDLRLTADVVDALLAEKDAALDEVAAVRAEAAGGPAGLDPALRGWLEARFALCARYLLGFRLIAEVCLYARWAGQVGADRMPRDRAPAFRRSLDVLERYGDALRPLATEAAHPHQVVMLLDYRRVRDIAREGRTAYAEFEAAT